MAIYLYGISSSPIKRHLPFATMRMDLEDIIVSEISHTQNTSTVWYHLFVMSKVVKLRN